MSIQSFLDKYGTSFAVAGAQYNIDPSLIAAQAYLESGGGSSGLTTNYNNLFGMTGHGDAGTVHLPTAGYANGQNFAVYSSPQASIDAYAHLIGTNPRYAGVVGQYGQAAADAVAAAGYAKDPNYASKVGGLISKISPTLSKSIDGIVAKAKDIAGNIAYSALGGVPVIGPAAQGVLSAVGLGPDSCGIICQLQRWIASSKFFNRVGLVIVGFIILFAAFYLLGRQTPEFKAAAKAFS